ncbi:hypothetical protein AAG747_25515 [Rapidithrix thailandica]|uniref:Uncharacterized protein n=1 Tax=Rapidithrix thailandica TaxID=413964 RepID=A0AAW9SD21_9BACT
MRSIVYLVCFLGSSLSTFGQGEVILNTEPFKHDARSVYIQKVLDERTRKNLGWTKNGQPKGIPLYLYPNATEAVQGFMDTSFPYTKAGRAIQIKIWDLEIQQSQSSITDIKTRVHMYLGFFERVGNQLKEIYKIRHYEEEVFPLSQASAIDTSHEKRIRAALEFCMLNFINDCLQKSDFAKMKSLDSEEVNSFKDPRILDVDSPLRKWYNLLTVQKIFSKYRQGWKVTYTGFADSEEDFILPFTLSYDQYSLKPKVLERKGYKSVDSYTLGGGLEGLVKILPGLYGRLGLHIPVGLESIKELQNKRKNNFLIGVKGRQGLVWIPWEDFGIVIGAGFFQQIQTSKIYKSDYGFELELGVNF